MVDWESVRDSLGEENPEAMLANGFEEALIGYGIQHGSPALAIYDTDKCIKILTDQGETYEEAVEYFDFNVSQAYVGPGTPMFLFTPPFSR